MDFHKISIQEVNHITPKAVQIKLDIPENLKKEYQFKAGEYLTFQFKAGDKFLRKEYSLCSAPHENEWSIGVKAVDTGFISKHLKNNTKVGDFLFVSSPNGKFGIPPATSKSRILAAFAGGSGITPILSIIKETLATEPQSKIVFFYGNNDQRDAMFLKEIQTLEEKYSENLEVHYFYKFEENEDAFYKGMIDSGKLDTILEKILPIDQISSAFVCGPEPMMIGVANGLYKNGLPKDKINFELFAPPSQPLFDDGTSAETSSSSSTLGEFNVKLILEDEIQEVKIENPQGTLLDELLDQDIEAPYSCKGGVCSSCIAKVTEGDVDFDKSKNFVLTEGEIADGFILCCQTKLKSSHLEIDFDDTP